jgi:hypothetical protein
VINPLRSSSPPENLVIAKKADGNFVMMETVDEVLELAKQNPGMFPEEIAIEQGRVIKDEKGVPCCQFSNFKLYFDENHTRT